MKNIHPNSDGDIVVAFYNNKFAVKLFGTSHSYEGVIYLVSVRIYGAAIFADAIKRERKSPNYTTRWNDIIEVECNNSVIVYGFLRPSSPCAATATFAPTS